MLSNTKYKLRNRDTHIDCKISLDDSALNDNNCTLEEQAIINLIKENPFINQEEIAQAINKSLRTVKTYMITMQEKGFIERVNGKKKGEWIVKI